MGASARAGRAAAALPALAGRRRDRARVRLLGLAPRGRARRRSAGTRSSTCCSTSGSSGRCGSSTCSPCWSSRRIFGPWLTRRLPRVRALEVLGAASLPVFCAHLVLRCCWCWPSSASRRRSGRWPTRDAGCGLRRALRGGARQRADRPARARPRGHAVGAPSGRGRRRSAQVRARSPTATARSRRR